MTTYIITVKKGTIKARNAKRQTMKTIIKVNFILKSIQKSFILISLINFQKVYTWQVRHGPVFLYFVKLDHERFVAYLYLKLFDKYYAKKKTIKPSRIVKLLIIGTF